MRKVCLTCKEKWQASALINSLKEVKSGPGDIKTDYPDRLLSAFLHLYRDNALHGFMDGTAKLFVSKNYLT